MTKGEAWQRWWKENHGHNMPMGSYHPMEGHMYEAFEAGWKAGISELPAVSDTASNLQSFDD